MSMRQRQDWDLETATTLVDRHAGTPGGLLPLLHALQEEFGYIAGDAMPLIAQAFNVTRAEVHGVVSFYHDFKRRPGGHHHLKLCRAEACQAMGAEAIASQILDGLGLEWGGTTQDGGLTIDAVFCLGLCACAPAALLDGAPIGRMTIDRLTRAMGEALA